MDGLRQKLRMRIGTIILIMIGALLFLGNPSSDVLAAEPPEESATEQPATPPSSSTAPESPPPAPVGPEAPKEKPIKIPLTEVIGTGPYALEHIPGSGRVVTQETLFKNHRFTINEALREVPGVNVRDEEGLGLRPNIGIRGLNPTRSTKLHIMEDGVPIMLMPYADPSAYYFPPLFRFDRIEILKGSGQLLYGPQNIGGVMNLITRMPPATPTGNLQFWAGNNNYYSTHLDYGGTWGKNGYLVDYTHYQSDTPRFTNIRAKVDDATFKTVQELSDRTQILTKFNYYREDSGVGYQGLTENMWATQDKHFTPFTHDNFDFRRVGFHVAVNHMFTANLTSTTNFFGHYINRIWSRQMQEADGIPGSNCTVSATGSVGGGCVTGNNLNADATQAVPADGRFINDRRYWVYGVEPRFHLIHNLLGIKSEADFGARVMYEQSHRQQFLHAASGIGVTCPAFTSGEQEACLGEDTFRTTNAYALFLQNRFFITENFTITPGVRVEHVNYDQVDRRASGGNGVFTKKYITEPLPGIGATYTPVKDYTLFVGVHRGFAPPQISDAIQSNVVVDLDAELSWNYEVGVRGTPTQWAWFELTGFRMDFQNQIVNQSVAGGTGATNTNAGRTAHMGLEFATKLDLLDMATGPDKIQDIIFDINYTWVAQAEFRGTRNSSVCPPNLTIPTQCAAIFPTEALYPSVNGNRLPYAPKHLLTAGIGYANRPVGFDARLETQCVSDMFGDDRNTHNPTPNGQRGIIRGWCILNAAANQFVKSINTTFFVVGKNLFDQAYIVDRTRGIYPGLPLLVQAGAKWTF